METQQHRREEKRTAGNRRHPELMTWQETALYLRVSVRTLRTWVDQGKFPQPARIGERTVVFRASEVEEFITASTKKLIAA